MNFSKALESLKLGKKIQRNGWIKMDMYLKMTYSYPVNGHLNPDSVDSEVDGRAQGKSGQMLPYIILKTAGDSKFWGEGYSDYIPWVASQEDILAEDWVTIK